MIKKILLFVLILLIASVSSVLTYIVMDWIGVKFFHDGSRVGYIAYLLDHKIPFGPWERVFLFFYA